MSLAPSPSNSSDIEVCTAREWIRIGRRLRDLPHIADAFANQALSYSKVRTLTRVATVNNEAELTELARSVPAGDLGRAIAAWMNNNTSPEDIAAHQQRQRSVKWRTEPDGMVTITLRPNSNSAAPPATNDGTEPPDRRPLALAVADRGFATRRPNRPTGP